MEVSQCRESTKKTRPPGRRAALTVNQKAFASRGGNTREPEGEVVASIRRPGEEIALHEFDAGIREALPATGNHLCGTVQGAEAWRRVPQDVGSTGLSHRPIPGNCQRAHRRRGPAPPLSTRKTTGKWHPRPDRSGPPGKTTRCSPLSGRGTTRVGRREPDRDCSPRNLT